MAFRLRSLKRVSGVRSLFGRRGGSSATVKPGTPANANPFTGRIATRRGF